jgi:hypothetical protein
LTTTETTEQRTGTIEVTVAFPLSPREPFHHRYARHETIATVRQAAMHHFGAQEEPGTVYYLTDDRHDDDRVEDAKTVGEVAGEHEKLHLTLVKDLVQG